MVDVGSHVRITVGGRSVEAKITRILHRGAEEHWADDSTYWDIEYDILDPAPGRGSVGRWKQNVDRGHLTLITA